jgi:hypothetical protein
MTLRSLCLVAFVACWLTLTARARACSCVASPGVKEDLAASGSVFEGKVIELRHDPARHRIVARVSVLRRWKGAPSKQLDVVTIDEGSMCGFGFERGKSYLLFTPEATGALSVSLCSRSQASELAAADFAELDRLAASEAGAPAPSASVSAPAREPPAFPDAAFAPPAPTPAVPASEPSTVAAEPRRGGCGGCSSTSHAASLAAPIAIALALGASARRRSRRGRRGSLCPWRSGKLG